ncbi:MAG: hypothetical protein KUG65_02075 [Sphingomonadaceae bacterium]|nr:hypothetical protein [Sphingomonadaceae bacterium]
MARGWHHRDRGLDAGDVFAGLLIIGGIAAVASAASKSKRESEARDYRYPGAPPPGNRYPSDENYRDWRDYHERSTRYGDPRGTDRIPGRADRLATGNMDAAVDVCVAEVERGNRNVDTVDGVNRDADGWRVDGKLRDGRGYSCSAGSDGRVRRMTVDGRAVM